MNAFICMHGRVEPRQKQELKTGSHSTMQGYNARRLLSDLGARTPDMIDGTIKHQMKPDQRMKRVA